MPRLAAISDGALQFCSAFSVARTRLYGLVEPWHFASTKQDHRATVRGLGLKWTNHTVEVVDTPATRGMINKVGYLLKVAG